MASVERRRLPPATVVGRYSVERFIGSGGMADVYAACDQHLGRTVALKILERQHSTDPGRVSRFVREAQLASALNHPNIVTVFDAGSDALPDGEVVHYLAMELLDGQALSQWMRSTRELAPKLELMASVADGLARAHAGGIIHRDLKPDNIMVVTGGHPKIVDFGIAKLTEQERASAFESTAPTAAFGTAAYMSPEQVEGLELDNRSDIFSFGAVLYELITGRPAFRRATSVETMHAILHTTPPPNDVPGVLQRIVRKCLARNRDERYHSIVDVALDLREAARELPALEQRTSRPLRTLAAGLLLIVAATTAALMRRTEPEAGAIAAPVPHNAPVMLRMTNTGNIITGAVSPDGNYIVHVMPDGENHTLWVKQVATGTNVTVIPPQPVYYSQTTVTRDGNYIFYSVADKGEPNIVDVMAVPLLGGQPRKVAADVEGNFALSPDARRIAFVRFNAFEREYRLTIGDTETLTERVIMRRRFPEKISRFSWSPDGAKLAFIGVAGGTYSGPSSPATKQVLSSKDSLFEVDVANGRVARIGKSEWPGLGAVEWLPDDSGFLVTASDQRQPPQIWSVPRNGDKSLARKITSDISSYSRPTATADARSFAATRSDASVNIWVVDIGDPAKARPLTTGLGNRYGTGGVRWMPDGQVLFTEFAGGAPALNLINSRTLEMRQLVRGSAVWNPVVSPDAKSLAFVSDRSGSIELWTSDLDLGNPRRVTDVGSIGSPAWYPDSKSLVYVNMTTEQTAWRVNVTGGETKRVTERPVNATTISPDGRYLLCRLRSVDPRTKLWRTALVPLEKKGEPRYFDVPHSGGPPDAQWLPDGSGFLFKDSVGGVSNLWLQKLDGSAPRQVTFFDGGYVITYDVSQDGKSIAMARGELVNDIVLIREFR